jgi:hypothetical protein
MFAEPRFVVAELVETYDQFQVTLEGEGRVLPDGVEGGEEDAEPQGPFLVRVLAPS